MTRSLPKCDQCRHAKKECIYSDVSQAKCARCERIGHPCGEFVLAGHNNSEQISTILPEADGCSTTETAFMDIRSTFPQAYTPIHVLKANEVTFDVLLVDLCSLHNALAVLIHCVHGSKQLHNRVPEEENPTFGKQLGFLAEIYNIWNVLYELNVTCWQEKEKSVLSDTGTWTNPSCSTVIDRIEFLKNRYLDLTGDTSTSLLMLYSHAAEIPGQWTFDPASFLGQLLCAQRLPAGTDLAGTQVPDVELHMSGLCAQTYLNIQDELHRVYFRILSLSEPDNQTTQYTPDGYLQISAPFPAAHLAYLHGDEDVARELTVVDGALQMPLNILGQNIAHLAAQAKDPDFLCQLRDASRSDFWKQVILFVDTGPLDIATILDCPEVVSIIVGEYSGIKEYTGHLLLVAIESGSLNTASYLLRSLLRSNSLIALPNALMLENCIKRGREEIALAILPRVLFARYDQPQFRRLAALAWNKGLCRLARRIRRTRPDTPNAQRAIASARRHAGLFPLESII